ncbi:ABC transporter ATP-binding protein [Rheinheimera soli]|uniref:ABC transporter ATP-binding protein n=1 Tax=Rheinheimera soli TaxID=443616 RepID=UPI001E5AA602
MGHTPVVEFLQVQLHIDQQQILTELTFAIEQGQFVGLLGPNGAGKTSLLRLLQKEYHPSSGQIKFKNQPLGSFNQSELAAKVALVSQLSGPLFDLTVADVVLMGLIPHKALWQTNTEQDLLQLKQSLKLVGLADKERHSFAHLSGGEQQRVLLARAVMQKPLLLLLDEPTNHLDLYYQHQVLRIAKALSITVIASIHDLNLASRYCDRLLLLNKGQLVADGTAEQVLTQELLTEVFRIPCLIDQNPFGDCPRVSFGYKDDL